MASFESAKMQPTMGQVVALTMTYRLFFKILQAPILLILALPVALRASYFIFDRLTGNHTILSMVTTWALTSSVRQLIRHLAPNKAAAQDALAKTKVRLPCLMFATTCIVAKYALSPLEDRFEIRSILTWSPVLTFSLAFRGCIFTLLLGLSIILRYVGPPSVMRCSSSPLLAHPFQTAVQNLLSNLTTDALLNLIAAPSAEVPSPVIRSPFGFHGNARRFQRPMFSAILSQFFLTILLASAVAYMSVLPLMSCANDSGDTSFKMAIILACIVSSLSHLVQSALNGRMHELNPARHRLHLSWTSSARLMVRSTANSLVLPSLFGIGSSMLARNYYMDEQDREARNEGIWLIVAISLMTGSAIYLFLQACDETVRHLLCTYARNMRTVIAEIADNDSNETFLDVTMYSILHSDMKLVDMLGSPSRPSYHDLEREEYRRNESAMKAMAATLLSKSTPGEASAYLEEDILRLSILASFGGGSELENLNPAIENNIKLWIEQETIATVTDSRSEPAVVPLVRALCAYIGGMGEALFICSSQRSSTRANPCLLPPGAIVCAIYAIQAATRLILYNLTVSTKILANWRSTHLSMLIPVFFTSTHRLEVGMVKFSQDQSVENPSSTDHPECIDLIRSKSPELLPLSRAIVECSSAVLEKLKSLEGIRKVNFAVSPECTQWIDSILCKLSDEAYQQSSPRSVIPFNGY